LIRADEPVSGYADPAIDGPNRHFCAETEVLMTIRHWMVLGGLLLLLILAVVGLVWTEPGRAPVLGKTSTATATAQQATLVDQRPLQTARKLAAFASTPEEQVISQEILVNADHELDLAFADALRDAQEHPAKPTPEIRALNDRIDQAEAAVKADQDRVDALTKALAAAPESKKDQIQQQLDLVQAQAAMDQDELDDARGDLSRAGGDPESKIRRLLDEKEASDREADAHPPTPVPTPAEDYSAGNLAAQIRAWSALREKEAQLGQARQDAVAAVTALTAKHQTLEQHAQQEGSEKQAVTQQAAGMIKSSQETGAAVTKEDAVATVSSLRRFSQRQKAMSDLDKRIQDQQQIADAYGKWMTLLRGRQGVVLHGMIRNLMWIVLIVFVVYACSRVIDRYFTELTAEQRRLLSVRVVVRFAVQAIGALLILFIIFGAPNQTPTILGLAGAGLTVALKDFIVAFFGWFVLMGRNGIRVGDWVEINGVGGEVVEIGLLRTVLLETGNWTDYGHPTGRRVAFVNSYAVEGHYFNFSTSGQWLWDELQVLVPAGQNPYPIIDSIQKLVLEETHPNSEQAEQEWQRATSHYRVQTISAVPSVNMRPTPGGVEVVIRYVVHAHERYGVRAKLYQAIVDLLQQKNVQGATARMTQGA
jgi:small-conductance mechanosensitive channel